MRNICLSSLFAVVLGLISVHAQDSNGWVCIQSDTGNALLVFNSQTGAYKFVRCKDGAAFSGTGQVKTDGCQIVLADNRPSLSVSASVNMCVQQGKGAVDVPKDFSIDGINFVPAMHEVFGDTNLRDNTCSCIAGGPLTVDSGEPEFIGPPVSDDGSSKGGSEEIIVKSDGGEAFIVFNSTTGDYKFVRCDGVAFSSTGQIKNDGCFIILEDRRENFSVIVAANICLQAGKFTVDVPKAFKMQDGSFVPEMHNAYGDSDLKNSTASCSVD